LERQVSRCQRHGESAALILIDLNNFKAVNDTYGHNAGDDLLQHVASAMEKRLRFSDSLARLGGDEFGVLLANVGEDETTNLIGVLREIVRNSTVDAAGTEVGVTASVGFVMLGGSTVSVVDALGEADAAMYLNKAALKGVTARSVI
jgi:diguanylate cyclase (GGDEF)-like protein